MLSILTAHVNHIFSIIFHAKFRSRHGRLAKSRVSGPGEQRAHKTHGSHVQQFRQSVGPISRNAKWSQMEEDAQVSQQDESSLWHDSHMIVFQKSVSIRYFCKSVKQVHLQIVSKLYSKSGIQHTFNLSPPGIQTVHRVVGLPCVQKPECIERGGLSDLALVLVWTQDTNRIQTLLHLGDENWKAFLIPVTQTKLLCNYVKYCNE